jgi:hypothetical protein
MIVRVNECWRGNHSTSSMYSNTSITFNVPEKSKCLSFESSPIRCILDLLTRINMKQLVYYYKKRYVYLFMNEYE